MSRPCTLYTHVADIATFENWHKGRKYYGVWMYRFNDATMIHLLSQLATSIRTALSTLPIHNFHITLFASGFLALSKRYDDDVCFSVIRRQIHAMKTYSLPAPRFLITGLTANAYNVFLSVTDVNEATTPLRQILAEIQGETAYTPYVLHITLGNYSQQHILADVFAMLSKITVPTFPILLPTYWLEFVTLNATTPLRSDIGLCHDHFKTLYRIL
ncbi:MAG: hypothetical protein IIT71_01350 [Acetobacter sp.]|nr:hypothetical protein [Acetobacter sp.]